MNADAIIKPPALAPGDKVVLVSPSSTPTEQGLAKTVRHLEGLGLQVVVGAHALDRYGYLAGRDEDRLADLNRALRDPDVRAVITTRGGKGAYRIAGELDFEAMAAYPKLLIGFSDITILHLAILKNAGVASLHGAAWDISFGQTSERSFYRTTFTTDRVTIEARPTENTAELTTSGRVQGRLIGGNQGLVATAAGWQLPDLAGAVLLLEAVGLGLGQLESHLVMLERAGHLDGLVGVAVGQYTDCDPGEETQGDWTAIDVLRDRLSRWGVPVLGGLPLGHGERPLAVPLGTACVLDADAGVLSVEAATS